MSGSVTALQLILYSGSLLHGTGHEQNWDQAVIALLRSKQCYVLSCIRRGFFKAGFVCLFRSIMFIRNQYEQFKSVSYLLDVFVTFFCLKLFLLHTRCWGSTLARGKPSSMPSCTGACPPRMRSTLTGWSGT